MGTGITEVTNTPTVRLRIHLHRLVQIDAMNQRDLLPKSDTDTLANIKDPVCGMLVTSESVHKLTHDGKAYYFCSAGCHAKFASEPQTYIDKPSADKKNEALAVPIKLLAENAIYTCPMHPEIRQDHPGNCPKCGMTLEPMLPTLDEEENPELVSYQRRFWWTLPMTGVVFILAMFGHRLGWFDMAAQSLMELVLSLPVVSVAAPRVTLPPAAPPPAREPICVLNPVMSRTAPAVFARITAELLPNAPLTFATEATPAFRVPAFTLVGPV